jgi:hypothetical protein
MVLPTISKQNSHHRNLHDHGEKVLPSIETRTLDKFFGLCARLMKKIQFVYNSPPCLKAGTNKIEIKRNSCYLFMIEVEVFLSK